MHENSSTYPGIDIGFIPEFNKPKDLPDRFFDPKATPDMVYATLSRIREKHEVMDQTDEDEVIVDYITAEIGRFMAELKNGSFALAKSMIAHEDIDFVLDHIHQFDPEVHAQIASEIIASDPEEAGSVAASLSEFANINYSDLALQMMAVGQVLALVDNWDNFPYLNQRVALQLSAIGFSDLVAKSLDKFHA